MSGADSAAELEQVIERYNDAWNAQDLDAVVAFHAPGMVFENHTAGERAEGGDVREHIGEIFANWPDLSFRGRRLYVRDGLVVSEWTATATAADGRELEWDGIDVFPFENGLILRKDVYSAGHRPRVLSEVDASASCPGRASTSPRRCSTRSRPRSDRVVRARRRARRAPTASLSLLTTASTARSSTASGPQLRVVANYRGRR